MSIRMFLDKTEPDNSIIGSMDTILSPEMYLNNPFGLLGLESDSEQQDIQKKFQKLSIAIKMDLGNDDGAYQRTVPLSLEGLQKSLEEVKNPLRRIVWELFWPWPIRKRDGQDDELISFKHSEIYQAIEDWQDASNSGRGRLLAVHNLAVVYHSAAIDASEGRPALFAFGQAGGDKDEALWSLAFSYWNTVIDHNAIWDYLLNRVASMDDPRVQAEDIVDLRYEITDGLLDINVQIACKAIDGGDSSRAIQQVVYLLASPFEQENVQVAVGNIGRYIKRKIDDSASSARNEYQINPRQGVEIAGRLFSITQPSLDVLKHAASHGGQEILQELTTIVAKTLMHIGIGYGNQTHDYERSVEVLDKALIIAQDEDLIAKLKENISIGRSLARQHSGIGQLSPISGDVGANTNELEKKQGSNKWKTIAWIAAALMALYFFFSPSSSPVPSKNTSNYPKSQSSTVSTSPPAANKPSQSAPVQSPSQSNRREEIDSLKGEIDSLKSQITVLESQLRTQQLELENLEQQVSANKSNRALHNSLVNSYNSKLANYNSQYEKYKGMIAEHNRFVAQYNNLIKK